MTWRRAPCSSLPLEVEPQPQNIQNQTELSNPGNYVGLNLDKKEPKHIAYTCWYESWQQLVKVKSIWSGRICSLPSPGHGALTAPQGVQHLECHQPTDSWQAQNVQNVSATQRSVLPNSLETHFFLAGGMDFRQWSWQHPKQGTEVTAPQFYTCPTTVSLALCLCAPQFGNGLQTWNVPKVGVQSLPCSLL